MVIHFSRSQEKDVFYPLFNMITVYSGMVFCLQEGTEDLVWNFPIFFLNCFYSATFGCFEPLMLITLARLCCLC